MSDLEDAADKSILAECRTEKLLEITLEFVPAESRDRVRAAFRFKPLYTAHQHTIADAILDRLVHNAHRLTLKGDSLSWSRLSEQIFRVDKWSVHRGYAAMRMGSGLK